jgi:hypothetical protein
MLFALEFIAHHIIIVLGAIILLVYTLMIIVREPVSAKKAANWPIIEATIRSVRRVVVSAGRSSHSVIAGDFTYIVNDEYYSGRLKISRSFSTHDATPKGLVDQKIQVRYNPRKPEQYSVPPQEVESFLLDPYDEPFGTEVDAFDFDTV